MTAPVFVCPGAATAAVGDVLVLDGAEGHHASDVQRIAAGERLDLVDGRGRRATGVVVVALPGRVEVRVDGVSDDDDRRVVLVQALAKGGRDAAAIEAATELGVTAVVPWAATRGIVEWRGDKVEKGRYRWAAVVGAAAKVARRALVPEVAPLVTTAGLVSRVREVVGGGARVVVLHETADVALADLPWGDAKGRPQADLWIVVGPEGGIADGEVEALAAAGASVARLGPHVLRSSTAGPAAIAAIAALSGAWSLPHRDAAP